MTQNNVLDALVVGAGPAGIGTALALSAVEDLTYGVVERDVIGQTFLNWSDSQRFLTPSFTGNGFGATDLNAIHPLTSPAYSLGVDYPSGAQYAKYLRSVAAHFHVPVVEGREVHSVQIDDGLFCVSLHNETVLTRHLVWAGGEHHEPVPPRIAGGSLLEHSSSSQAWDTKEGPVVILGGYESGIELAVHHAKRGTEVTVVDQASPWDAKTGSDPSFRLAPRTRQWLRDTDITTHITLIDSHAASVKSNNGGFQVRLSNGSTLTTPHPPIAAVGFGPGLGPVAQYFETYPDGSPMIDELDQSTLVPHLYLAGPAMRHRGMKFCFIYKFRQRFAHVAGVIGTNLGKDISGLSTWREAGMLTDDLSCCDVECAC